MFKTILLPVDLAHLDEGKKTLDIALNLSNPDTTIVMLYVFEEIPNWTDINLPANFKEDAMQTAQERLESITADAGREVKIEVRAGHVYSMILQEAGELDADLIILASHKPGLKDYFIGSNTTKVVSHAGCSVMVMR